MFSPAELAAMQQNGVTPPLVTPRILAYSRLDYILIYARELCVWVSLFLVLHFGWSALLRDAAYRISGSRVLRIVAYVLMLNAVLALLRFPYNLYAGFFVEHQFALSNETLFAWCDRLLTAQLVNAGLQALGFSIAFAIIDRFPRRWPLVTWCALTPLIAFMIFAYPLIIDPLFNKYTPMPDSPVKQAIEQLVHKAGMPSVPIFVVNKSKQTTKLNAEVTGLGPTTRVVIWDNTLRKLPEDQLLAVVGHELGHYVLGHILLGFVIAAAGLFFGLQIAGKAANRFLAVLPKRWGIKGLTDPAMIAALLLVGAVLGFLLDPLFHAISREMEHQADAYGLKLTGNGPAMARLFVTLSQDNLSEPDPPWFVQFWSFNHPSLRERIDFALGIKG